MSKQEKAKGSQENETQLVGIQCCLASWLCGGDGTLPSIRLASSEDRVLPHIIIQDEEGPFIQYLNI